MLEIKLSTVSLCAAALVPVAGAVTVIPSTSFSSYSTLESYWNYLYPWGSDHNGSARMVGNSTVHSNIAIASSTLSLIATPTSNASPPTSTTNPHLAIHYASGAINAKDYITVTAKNSYTIYGEFSAPTAVGTWPAFWLTVSTLKTLAQTYIFPLVHRQLRVDHLRRA